jgi:hypothetical protein
MERSEQVVQSEVGEEGSRWPCQGSSEADGEGRAATEKSPVDLTTAAYFVTSINGKLPTNWLRELLKSLHEQAANTISERSSPWARHFRPIPLLLFFSLAGTISHSRERASDEADSLGQSWC